MKLLLLLIAGIIAASLGAAPEAAAHARSTSFSFWTLEGEQLRGRLVFPWVEIGQAFPEWKSESPEDVLADARVGIQLAEFFQQQIVLPASCVQERWPAPVLKDSSLVFRSKATCPAGVDSIRFNLTFDVAPSHVHLVRFEREGALLSGVVTPATREWDTGSTMVAAETGWRSFVRSGFEHILAGMDHLFFLAALLLLAPSLWAVLALATGFTIAHSLSLGIAVLGLVRPDGATVEALIGFTVAFSALEVFVWLAPGNAEGKRFQKRLAVGYALIAMALVAAALLGGLHLQSLALAGVCLFTVCFLALNDGALRWRWLLVFLFGFIHGFGFAGPLLDLDLGRGEMAKALLGFNLGVEGGQLLFLLILWPLATFARRLEPRIPVSAMMASCILAAGTFWFLGRAL